MKSLTLTKLHHSATFYSAILFLLSLLTACNSVGEVTLSTQSEWSATLNYSGGFAGLMRSISIDQTGKAVFQDNRTGSQIERKLEPDHLQVYADLVKILPGRTSADNRSNQCRDCINYSLVVVYDGIHKRRMADDLSLKDSDAKALISKLTKLASELDKNK